MTTDHIRIHGVHVAGTTPLRDSEPEFRTATGQLGGRLERLSDEETWPRCDGTSIQAPVVTRAANRLPVLHPALHG